MAIEFEEVTQKSDFPAAAQPKQKIEFESVGEYDGDYKGSEKSTLKKVGESVKAAGIGGAIGALTPEILTGLGLAAGTFPPTMAAAPYLLSAGQIARTGRLGTAAASALTSGGAKLAGEFTPGGEKPVNFGTLPGGIKVEVPRKDVVENVIGFGQPIAGALAKAAVVRLPLTHHVVAYARQGGENYSGAAARELANFRNRTPLNELLQRDRASERLSSTKIDAYENVFNFLQGKSQATQNAAINQISVAQAEADKILLDATNRANALLAKDKVAAKAAIDAGDIEARRIIDQAINDVARKNGIARRAQTASLRATESPNKTLQAIGDVNVANADMGSSLQQRVVANLSAEEQAVAAEYNRARKTIDDIVRQKESQGVGVKETQAFGELRDFIDSKLLRGKFGKEAKFAPVTETQLKNVYENVYKAIADQQILIGVGVDGTPIYRKVPSSFDALDHVRRKLGEVFDGKAVEGYEGLLKNEAKELYGKIRKIQTEYTDNAYDAVLKNYAEGKGAVNEFGIPTGAKLTKTDRLNPEYLTYDPSGLPAEFFSSRKKVGDLLSLVRDPKFVEQQAANHVARVLKDKDAKFAEKFLFDNKEWIGYFPSLRANIDAHIAALGRAGSVGPKASSLAQSLKTEVKALPGVSQKEAANVQKEAGKTAKTIETESQKQAKDITAEAQRLAKEKLASVAKVESLLGKGDKVKQIETLITGGQTQTLEKLAPFIKSDPDVMKSFNEAVMITLSRSNPATIVDDWERTIRPGLVNNGLISASQADDIAKRIRTVALTLAPNEAKLLMTNIIRSGLTTMATTKLSGE
jgi:hypothetical protein